MYEAQNGKKRRKKRNGYINIEITRFNDDQIFRAMDTSCRSRRIGRRNITI